MTIPNRTVSIKSVFASTANTTIPTPPAPGVSYRNTGTTAAEIGEGWPFKEVVDSAKFNQAMYEYTTICQQVEKYGFLPWSANTDYPAQGCALGSDGKIYQAKQTTGPSSTSKDPTTDTSHTYWDLFYYAEVTANRALVSNANGKMAASSVTATELGYVHGVTSNIQTQLNAKQSSSDVSTAITDMLKSLFPVGSIYIGTQSTCPLASLISGSQWTLVAQDRALWGGNGSNANTTIAAGLPNITGTAYGPSGKSADGAFTVSPQSALDGGNSSSIREGNLYFNASRSNSIYGNSNTVQPPAYRVNIWRRTA